jgi:hypothetical protein
VAGAVVIASRAILALLGLIVKLTPSTRDDEVVTGWQKAFDGLVAGLKVTALNIPASLTKGTGDGTSPPPIIKIPPALLLLPLVLVLVGGCMGGHDFQMQAPIHGSQVMAQLGTGTEEYHTAETLLFNQAEAKATDDLKTNLAKYVLQVAAKGGTATVDDAKKAIEPAFTTYATEKGKIDGDRRSEGTRYRNMLELLDYGKRIFAQIAEIEGLRYATYDELRQMSKEFINQTLTNAGKAPAPTTTGGTK